MPGGAPSVGELPPRPPSAPENQRYFPPPLTLACHFLPVLWCNMNAYTQTCCFSLLRKRHCILCIEVLLRADKA